ncbi:lamin tail domain-containing protein [Candidatus Latescibacterota bacterium]
MKSVTNLLLSIAVTFAFAGLSATAGFTEPVINEIMSINTSTIQDIDGDYPDWIEIYNPDSSPVDLDGYGLSDDPDDLLKWVFPKYSLKSGEYMLIFASDKDISSIPGHWETVINMGDDLKYATGSVDISENWRTLEFDDSEWLSGPSGIGSQGNKDSTMVSQSVSLFIRKSFDVADVANITHALLQIDYDDGFVAYINGNEIIRSNIDGTPGTFPTPTKSANAIRDMAMYAGGNPDVFEIKNIQSFIKQGENVLSIEVHNRMRFFSNISVIPFLTLGMKNAPSNPQGIPEIIKFSVNSFALHTNFKLKSDGETVFLTNKSEIAVDSLQISALDEDVSIGRKPDGGTTLVFFSTPTPGESNTAQAITGDGYSVAASVPGGFYDDSVSVEFSTGSANAVIRYTLDGSVPTDSSMVYSTPVVIDTTKVVRARTFEAGLFPGAVITNTYIINEDIELPIISVSTNPENLWDPDIGIYVKGNSTTRGGYEVQPTGSGNYCEDWERPIHIEFYEPDGTQGFSIDAGVKIVGKGSRGNPQKSLAVFARPEYGYEEIDYKIFPDLPTTKFKSLVIRAGGSEQNQNSSTLFRDGMHQTLMQPLDLEVQGYRPAVVFINGVYWGVQNIREKLNEDYLASYHGVDPDRVDILDDYHAEFVESDILQEYQTGVDSWTCMVVEGNADHYNALLRYMLDNDESDPEVYEYLKTQIDMENLIDYIAARIFIADPDGPGHNTKLWRPQTDDGKWRWLMYDTEFGSALSQNPFGIPGPAYLSNLTDYYIRDIQSARSPDANFLMYSLLENDEFKAAFVNRYSDHLNTIFSTEQVIPQVEKIAAAIKSEMPKHIVRHDFKVKSMDTWYANVETVKEFFELRPEYARLNIVSELELGGTADVTLDVSESSAGNIQISSLTISEFPWTGIYFQDVPVKLTAIPAPGYSFTGWTGSQQSESISISVTLSEAVSITANFTKDSSAINTIVINEINYNSSNTFDPEDWVELYNAYDVPVDISGWVFKDGNDANSFVIPDGSIIPADGYFILSSNALKFHDEFKDVEYFAGDFGFGLSNAGDTIRLYNSRGILVDSLMFDDEGLWPVEPDGSGTTLSLRNPVLDNSLSANWASSISTGTPGESNDVLMTDIIVINEINYNSADDLNPEDWVEFYNQYDTPVDISGWSFKDDEDIYTFVFPDNTIIDPGEFFIVCRDTMLFKGVFGEIENCFGDFEFGLSGGGEKIYLYDIYGDVVDKVYYNDVAPWPVDADGKGTTLSLTNPSFDNLHADNWASSLEIGTPGKINDVFNSGIVIINEINYNSPEGLNSDDWIELYNPQGMKVDISGWIFKDDDETHAYIIPDDTFIGPNDYLVICSDAFKFFEIFPDTENYIGDTGFGLSNTGDRVRIYDARGALVDSLTFDDEAPWPIDADGRGHTLALLNPEYDNALPDNWSISIEYGTPGKINSVYDEGPSSYDVYSLGQNYPNPFNEMTTISIYVPVASRVTIEIYSILGRRVSKLVDEHMPPGDYNIIFKPENLSSGPYVYTIKAGKYTKSKQMMFIK